ncbi:MAG TPA: type II secretion system F family protein [Candidatus Saccharimonadia bacterium]
MATYNFTARDHSGTIQKGSLVANDQAAAAASLLERDLVPILIKVQEAKTKGKGLQLGGLKLGGRVKLEDKVIFSRQFATMINAGVPLTQALSMLGGQTTNKHFRDVINDAAKQVEGGSTLSNALAGHPDVFSQVYVNMVKAGEAGGLLDQVLERLAVQQEKDAAVVAKVRSAMIYPGILLSVTVGAFVFLMTYLVPRMSVIFESLGTELPWYSKLMLAMSDSLVNYGLFLLIGLVVLAVVGFRFVHTIRGKTIFDSILIRMPIFGPIIVKVNVARFSRTFGSLMASGLSVLEALNTSADGLNNSVFRDGLHKVASEVKAGKTIAEPLKALPIFPPIVGQMVAVGEETGKLDEILLKLAGFYEREVDTVVAGITSVIEPILIVSLGGIVGFIVVGVYGPLATLNNAI